MQETRNNCFGSKKYSTTLLQAVIGKHSFTFRHSCLPISAWRRVVLHFFDPKQLFRVSWILWCYLSKWFSIIPFFVFPFYLKFKLLLKRMFCFIFFYDHGFVQILNLHGNRFLGLHTEKSIPVWKAVAVSCVIFWRF